MKLRIAALATASAGAAALLLAVSPARAAETLQFSGMDEAQVNSETVHFSDLDLSSPKDASRLYTRIRVAAENVCGDYDLRDYVDTREARQCENDAIHAAVAKVNRPMLTAIYDRSHHPA